MSLVKNVLTLRELKLAIAQRWSRPAPRGDSTGWTAVDELYTVVPGQFTVVTGWPSSGKSEWVDALALNLARQGWKFALCSPENRPVDLHGIKLLEKWVGRPFFDGPTPRMSLDVANEAGDEIGDAFGWIEPPGLDNLAIDQVVGYADQHFEDVGRCKRGLIIDPWNEFDHSRDPSLTETEYVSKVLSFLRNWARLSKTHVWVVAHPAKQKRETSGHLPVPKPDMIAGSQNWWNKADNAITVFRDYERDDGEIELYVQKVRFKHVGKIGRAVLHWDKVTGQYSEPQRDHEGRVITYSHGRAA